jgi:hypothetical protein
MHNFLKFFLLPAFLMIAVMTACNKTDSTTTADAVDEALYAVQERGGMGRFGCYELVFPVSFTLPDSSTVVTANSYDDIKNALHTYFEENPVQNGSGHGHGHGGKDGKGGKHINFVFPISVINEAGEVITVADEAALKVLHDACAGTFGDHGPKGHGQHGLSCFSIVFPITLTFPDSTTATVDSQQAFHDAVHTWRANNPGSTGRPQIVFPITIKMTADGSTVTVASHDELHTIKDNCE